MKKIFLILLFSSFVFAETAYISELRNCYDNSDQECGYKLASELVKRIKTEKEGVDLFLQLTLMGDKRAPTQLGRVYIYSKVIEKDCKKGITFLFLASKTDPEAIKELSLLFKRGVCVHKDKKMYKKYINIYFSEKKKSERITTEH